MKRQAAPRVTVAALCDRVFTPGRKIVAKHCVPWFHTFFGIRVIKPRLLQCAQQEERHRVRASRHLVVIHYTLHQGSRRLTVHNSSQHRPYLCMRACIETPYCVHKNTTCRVIAFSPHASGHLFCHSPILPCQPAAPKPIAESRSLAQKIDEHLMIDRIYRFVRPNRHSVPFIPFLYPVYKFPIL